MNPKKPLNILIPSLGFGHSGGYRVLSELANSWIKAGHKVTFLINEVSSDPYFPTSACIIWNNYFGKIIRDDVQRNKKLKKLNAWLNLFGLYFSLNIIGKNYDIILANHSLTAWSVRFANCKKAKKIYYVQAYEPEYYEHENTLRFIILRWLAKMSYDFNLMQICNSPVYIGYKNVQATEWVPPGINFDIFYKKLATKDFTCPKEIILGCVGRKEPVKGTKYVLEAFEILYNSDNRFRLYVAFGNLPEGYAHSAVSIISPQNDMQLSDFYRSLDILIAPGLVQLGAPHYPVMEAMSCGIPVVTTGYMPANEKNSWIVDVASTISIVSAIRNILNDKTYFKKVNQANKDISDFDWDTISNKMLYIISIHNI